MGRPTTIDKLITLARGDVFLVERAIGLAVRSDGRARLGDVTRLVLAMRDRLAALPPAGGR